MIIFDCFTYVGPNRRSNLPVQEISFVLTQAERIRLDRLYARFPALIAGLNDSMGIAGGPSIPPLAVQNTIQALADFFATQALLLQNCLLKHAGYGLVAKGLARDNKMADAQCYFEYDDNDTVLAIVALCTDIFSAFLAEDSEPDLMRMAAEFSPRLHLLIDDARSRTTPADTRALLEAASLREIPWLRMEKTGYGFQDGEFRLRKNSLLNLGFGCNRVMIDGTFCVDRSFACFELVRDREKLLAALAPLDIPQPRRDPELGARNSVTRILRTAERIGYPVSIKTSKRTGGLDSLHHIADKAALETAAEKLLAVQRSILVETWVAGTEFRILVAKGILQAVLRAERDSQQGCRWRSEAISVHPDTLEVIGKVVNYFPVGIIEIRLVVDDISRSIHTQQGAVVDVRMAPVLDDLAQDHADLLKRIALAFVDWIFPDPAATRIPIVTVTGTNGKTSTSRMIDSVFRLAGRTTGLACTDGFYVAGNLVTEGDFAGFPGHLSILNSSAVEVAVLESARGGAVQLGLGFDQCDVGVCLNVTEDHLGEFGIHTLDDMVRVKLGIVSRASKAVVLNADNPQCMSMVSRLQGRKICLVSIAQSFENLQASQSQSANPVNCFAVIEQREGIDWMVIRDRGEVVPIVPVRDIPATFGGAARHYVANALHAVAACYLSQLAPDVIRQALSAFSLSYEMAPGRLNIHRGQGVTVIMDFAQNPDSLRELIGFIDTLPTQGRRLIGLSCSAINTDALIRETAQQAAGKFDHYVCKNFKFSEHRQADEVPRLLGEGLLARGVDPSLITRLEDPMGAVESLLDMAREGDLIVLMTGRVHREETWKLVTGRLA